MKNLLSLGHVKAYRSLSHWYIFLSIVFWQVNYKIAAGYFNGDCKHFYPKRSVTCSRFYTVFFSEQLVCFTTDIKALLASLSSIGYRLLPPLLQLHTALLCEHPTSREILIKIPSEILPTQKGERRCIG